MAHKTDIHVGARLRELRLMKGMTQMELADRLGVSFQQVQKYEKGTNRIGSSRLWDICKVLTTPVSYFFEGLDAEAPKESAYSRQTLELAKAINNVGDDAVKHKFIELIRAYGKAS